jgi:glucose dehydrogenase
MGFNHKFRAGFFSSCLLALAGSTCAAQEIVPSHAFSAEELTALPSANWLTNGGNTYNQRYSPLTQINRFNVQSLKALWTFEMGSGDQNKNGGQAQILHYQGHAVYSERHE